jgi:hypothetical protein
LEPAGGGRAPALVDVRCRVHHCVQLSASDSSRLEPG